MKWGTLGIAVLLLFSLSGCSDGISVYFPEEESFWLVPETRVIEAENLPQAVLDALLAGPTQEGLVTLIPEGVRVNSLDVRQGVCFVDFSPEFNSVDYGSGPEAALLGMIVNTLTGLEGVDAVYITVEGEIPQCFRHIGSSGPFTWNESQLKKFRLP